MSQSAAMPSAHQTHHPNRLGRSAWVVMFAGLFGMGAIICVTVLCEGYAAKQRMDIRPAFQVALALGAVTLIWAPLLAVRALQYGENPRLSIWLINFATIPPALYAGAYWFKLPDHILLDRPWIQEYLLPVVMPFLSAVCISGTLLIPRLMRAIERRRQLKERPTWTPRLRRRWVIGLGACWFMLLGILLLPVTLFFYSVLFPRNEETAHFNNEYISTPQLFIMKHTPNFIRDNVESFLHSRTSTRLNRAPIVLLRMGFVSTERLAQRAADPNPQVSSTALKKLSQTDPHRAADLALKLLANAPTTFGGDYGDVERIVGQHGTRDQRRQLLAQATQRPLSIFFDGLCRTSADEELIPLLEAHLHSQIQYHEHALPPLVVWLPEARAEKLLKEAVDSSDTAVRNMALSLYWNLPGKRSAHVGLISKVLAYGIEHKDIVIRKESWDRFFLGDEIPRALRLEWVRHLLTMLDGEDIVQRRAAAYCLVHSLLPGEMQQLQFNDVGDAYTPADPNNPVETGGEPAQLIEVERTSLDAIAKAAREWLAKQEHSK